jgi:DNA repair exonuclease SbcCD ATPase subunit
MIRRVRLRNWRAYRQLDLPVGPGVTFLVAANGVGKSSLLEAVRWALSPDLMPADSSVIRHGHDEAAVAVTLATDRGDLEVQRVMRLRGSRGASSLSVRLDGRELQEAEFRRLLADAWSADLSFTSKTAFLTEDLRAEKGEPDLRAHLCRVYSLDELHRALTEIRPALGRANREVRSARAELTATEAHLTAARQAHADLERLLAVSRTEVAAARERRGNAQRAAEKALAARQVLAAAAAWDERSTALRRDIGLTAGSPEEQASAPEALHRAKLLLRQEAEAARAEQARLSARLEAAEEALASLRASGGHCPVCLRELDSQSREQAEHRHLEGLTGIRERLDAIDPGSLLSQLDRIEALELRAAALGDRPAPAAADTLHVANREVTVAQTALEQAIGVERELEIAARSADQDIQRITAELAEAEQLKRRYREVALLEAAQNALDLTISSVLGEQLAPLAREVNRRWRTVFPDRPNLMLGPDGTISRDTGSGSPLAFAAFSAGEQMVARLMMRMTTLLVTTRVPFCWVDEPLEHLDPRNRHLVGSMLAHLGTTSGLEQIFVTTYEEPLARRLSEFQPDQVRVEYLRTEPVS